MTATILTAQEHCDTLGDLLAEALRTCVQLGIRPVAVQVHTYPRVPLEHGVRVHIDTGDTAAVDAFADAYGLPADNGETTNYDREGRTSINGREVEMCAFTGRPVPAEVTA